MLIGLELSDWKSFGRGGGARNNVEFGSLTLLVGPNASGKSNVLDALRFLQGAASDLPLYEVLRGRWEGGREVWAGIRGGEAEAARATTPSFGLTTRWKTSTADNLRHSIEVTTGKEVSVEAESLWSRQFGDYFDTEQESLGASGGPQAGGAIKVALKSKGSGRSTPQILRSSHSLLGQIESGGRVDPAVQSHSRMVRGWLRAAVFFDLQPREMRRSAPIGAVSLGLSGENLAAVLKSMPQETRADLVDWLSELCAPRLHDIGFAEVEQIREVFFLLKESDERTISSRSASDGTLRFLGILTALLTSPEDSLIVFEEPDVGLHPARVHLLAELLEEITAKRKVQVIATTHSPILLAHLTESALRNVVAFDRDPNSGLTVCSRVGNLPGFETLLESSNRDHLVATGWLERAL